MELLLIRFFKTPKYAFGGLYINDQWECYTLEDPVREILGQPVNSWKIKGETAIPIGRYEIIINYSDRFKRRLPLLLEVPGFTGIRIHTGNTTKDTEGCILVGSRIIEGEMFLQGSKAAFDPLFARLEETLLKEKVWITIA